MILVIPRNMIMCKMFLCTLVLTVILQSTFYVSVEGSQVRLVNQRKYLKNGKYIIEGLLEVYAYDQWGNVCDDEFSNLSATVVCKMLGLNGWSGVAKPNMGGGLREIQMDQVKCVGSEESILDCPYNGWGNHDCQHSEDVGVQCVNHPAFSLSGRTSGILQTDTGNGTYNVCNLNVHPSFPSAVCRSLGLISDGSIDAFTASSEFSVYGIKCEDYMKIETCTYMFKSDKPCQSGHIAFKCSKLKLIGDANTTSGLVSIMHQHQWGSICDDGFSNTQASVICRELGFSWNGRFSAEYRPSTKHSYFLDNVACSGRESSITSCDHSAWKVHNCDTEYREDVGVECLTEKMDLKISSGYTDNEGIAQIYLGDHTVNICRDYFDENDALVFCRELRGRCRTALIVEGSQYKTSVNTTYQEVFNCKGIESRLIDCPRYSHDCPMHHYVAVVCDPTVPSVDIDIPSPLTVNVTVNLTCTSHGGVPAPKIWWDCCNYENSSVMLSHLGNNTVSVIEISPDRFCNGVNCTCFLHQEETTNPVIAESDTLLVLYPVLESFTLETPMLIEHTPANLSCSSSSGNPLPQLWWSCDKITADNVTFEMTSSTSQAIITLTPNRIFNDDNCSCFGLQENTTFLTFSETVKMNVLYAVLDVTVTSTILKHGELAYMICRASPGNPHPAFQWKCDVGTQSTFEAEIDNSYMSIMSFIFSSTHIGINCTCIVSQGGTDFVNKTKSIVLNV